MKDYRHVDSVVMKYAFLVPTNVNRSAQYISQWVPCAWPHLCRCWRRSRSCWSLSRWRFSRCSWRVLSSSARRLSCSLIRCRSHNTVYHHTVTALSRSPSPASHTTRSAITPSQHSPALRPLPVTQHGLPSHCHSTPRSPSPAGHTTRSAITLS